MFDQSKIQFDQINTKTQSIKMKKNYILILQDTLPFFQENLLYTMGKPDDQFSFPLEFADVEASAEEISSSSSSLP